MTKEQARRRLRESGLRVTSPRVAVLRSLSEAEGPLSFTQVLEQVGDADWDQATIFRNLVKLRDAGVAAVVSRAGGVDRYAIAGEVEDDHQHPHFLCEECGRIACMPVELTTTKPVDGAWSESIRMAMVQLLGSCPDCLPLSR